MKVARLVLGIISIVIFHVIVIQLIIPFIDENYEELIFEMVIYDFLIAIPFLLAGIISISTLKSKGGGITAGVFYIVGGMAGVADLINYNFLNRWMLISFSFGIVHIIGSIFMKTAVNVYDNNKTGLSINEVTQNPILVNQQAGENAVLVNQEIDQNAVLVVNKEEATHEVTENTLLEKSYFDGRLIQLIGWTILCTLVNVITIFILYPVTMTWKIKWKYQHTVYDGKRLVFKGNGFGLLLKWILWLLLSVITIGIFLLFIPIKLEKWKASNTTLVDDKKSIIKQA